MKLNKATEIRLPPTYHAIMMELETKTLTAIAMDQADLVKNSVTAEITVRKDSQAEAELASAMLKHVFVLRIIVNVILKSVHHATLIFSKKH